MHGIKYGHSASFRHCGAPVNPNLFTLFYVIQIIGALHTGFRFKCIAAMIKQSQW